MKLDVRTATELQQRAHAGDVQAIAYWLNVCLLPQEQCARVSLLSPGYFDIQVRCRSIPDGDRLLQSIHERLCRLALPNLRGAKIQISLDRPYPRVLEDRFLIFQPVLQSPQPVPLKPRTLRVWQKVRSLDFRPPLRNVSLNLKEQSQVWLSRFQAYLFPPASSASIPSFSRPGLRHKTVSHRPPALLGAAIATFAIGCSYELLTYYGTSPLRASSRILPSVPVPFVDRGDRSLPNVIDTVQVGNKHVPVYAISSATSGKGAIDLLFMPALDADSKGQFSALPVQADVTLSTLADPSQMSGMPLQASEDSNSKPSLTIAHLSGQFIDQAGSGTATRARNTLEWQGIYTTQPSLRPSAANQPLVLDLKGQRIAYLSYTVADAQDSTIQAVTARLTEDIAELQDQTDWIVVNYDTTENLASYPSDWQTDVARFAVDQGADVVVGYSVNTVQGAERYESGAIAYALGNLDLSQSAEGDTADATIPVAFQVQLRRDRPVQAELIPLTPLEGSVDFHRAMLYFRQASGLFDDPIPATTDDAEMDTDLAGEPVNRSDDERSPLEDQGELELLDGFTADPIAD